MTFSAILIIYPQKFLSKLKSPILSSPQCMEGIPASGKKQHISP